MTPRSTGAAYGPPLPSRWMAETCTETVTRRELCATALKAPTSGSELCATAFALPGAAAILRTSMLLIRCRHPGMLARCCEGSMYRNNRRRRAATLTALVRLHSKFHIRFHFHTSWAYTMRVRAFAAEVARFSHCMSNYPRSSTGLSLRGATLRGLGMTEAHVHRCYQFALSQLQLTASHRGVCHTTHVCHTPHGRDAGMARHTRWSAGRKLARILLTPDDVGSSWTLHGVAGRAAAAALAEATSSWRPRWSGGPEPRTHERALRSVQWRSTRPRASQPHRPRRASLSRRRRIRHGACRI
jgi:hypothetical protein